METVKEKIARISKSGLKEFETLDEGFETKLLMAHIQYLSEKIRKMENVLDYISSTLPEADECHAIADKALRALTETRDWRSND